MRGLRSRLRGLRPGRLPAPGHDHAAGHRSYVARLSPGEQHYLRTKPFAAPPSHELPYALRFAAHLVEELQPEMRAQVLDAGCGPGWLSEILARCGCWVTAVDISEDMVEIARERVAAIPGDVAPGVPALAEFHAMPIGELPFRRRFDAIVMADSLHHFDDEVATLRTLREALVPGGRILVHEAARPARGSVEERVFVDEMAQHGTLESPFDPRALVRAVRRAGFADIRRLAPVDRLVEPRRPVRVVRDLIPRALRPSTNTVVASAPPEPGLISGFAARLSIEGPPDRERGRVGLALRVRNAGDRWWPGGGAYPFAAGEVTVAPHRPTGRDELPRVPLPGPLAPGEEATVRLDVPAGLYDAGDLRVDVVREGLSWFSDLPGAPPPLRPGP